LVTNPIPQADEIPAETLRPVIEAALADAEQRGISAKQVTPFLLDHIFHATNGASLAANIALVRNNARLAASIAQAYTRN
jgi:pseudouridine-5'-phosphate glycosidase